MLKDLLIPITSTAGDEDALAAGIALADALSARLTVLAMAHLPLPLADPWGLAPNVALNEAYQRLRAQGEVNVARLKARLDSAEVSSDVQLVDALVRPPERVAAHRAHHRSVHRPGGDVAGGNPHGPDLRRYAPRCAKRFHYFGIVDLPEVAVVQPDGVERRGRGETDHLVGEPSRRREAGGRSHRNRAYQSRGARGAQAAQRREHGGAGGQPVVDHAHGAAGHRARHASRAVALASFADQFQLPACLALDIATVGAGHVEVLAQRDDARLVHGTDGEFRIRRRAELAHQHHVQVAVERLGDHASDRHAAAGDRHHQGIAAAVTRQGRGQPLRRILPIAERKLHRACARLEVAPRYASGAGRL